jgi:predicted nucleic acid-binding protein
LPVSIISAMELTEGCRNGRELNLLHKFLLPYLILPVTDLISLHAYTLMQTYYLSHGLIIPDSLIAATALDRGWTLYTQNVRHFQMISGLTVVRPY